MIQSLIKIGDVCFFDTEVRDSYLEERQYHIMLCISRISVEDVSLKITITKCLSVIKCLFYDSILLMLYLF